MALPLESETAADRLGTLVLEERGMLAVAVHRGVRVKDHESGGDKDAVHEAQDDEEDAGACVGALAGGRPAVRVQRRGDALEKYHSRAHHVAGVAGGTA